MNELFLHQIEADQHGFFMQMMRFLGLLSKDKRLLIEGRVYCKHYEILTNHRWGGGGAFLSWNKQFEAFWGLDIFWWIFLGRKILGWAFLERAYPSVLDMQSRSGLLDFFGV